MAALHPLEDHVVAGLQRQVDMRHHARFAGDQVEQAIVNLDAVERGPHTDVRGSARGVGDFETLLQACVELGARLIVCEMGLRSLDIDRSRLRTDVPFTIAGIVTLLEETKPGMHLLTL